MSKLTIHLNPETDIFVRAHTGGLFENGAYTLHWFPWAFKPIPDRPGVYELIKLSDLPVKQFNELDILNYDLPTDPTNYKKGFIHLYKDIQRIKNRYRLLQAKNTWRKQQMDRWNELFAVMMADGRLTKEELSKYSPPRKSK